MGFGPCREVGKEGIVVLSRLNTTSDRFWREHLYLACDHLDARAPSTFTIGIYAL